MLDFSLPNLDICLLVTCTTMCRLQIFCDEFHLLLFEANHIQDTNPVVADLKNASSLPSLPQFLLNSHFNYLKLISVKYLVLTLDV